MTEMKFNKTRKLDRVKIKYNADGHMKITIGDDEQEFELAGTAGVRIETMPHVVARVTIVLLADCVEFEGPANVDTQVAQDTADLVRILGTVE